MSTKKPYKDNTIHEFPLDIYLCKVWIAIGTQKEALNDLFDTNYDDKSFENTRAFTALTVRTKPDRKKGVLLWFRDSETFVPSTIVHEAIHAALEIFDEIGETVDAEHQETFAYLVDFVVRCCEQWLSIRFKVPKSISTELDY